MPFAITTGNLTTGPLQGMAASFAYNARNQLTQAGGTTYSYDPEGRRIEQTTSGVTTTYTINPHAPYSQVLVATTAGAATRYVYAQGLLLYEERPDGSLRVPHTDLRGSTVALSDGQGTVVGRLAYGPYGEITATSGQTDTPFKFHGAYGVQTDANGLLHMRARYYSVETRRFLNADPIGFGGGMNWYAFAGGNPVGYLDPLGLCGEGASGEATTAPQPGYWDRYIQHIEQYAVTVPPAVGASLIGGGAVPKSWVPWTGGRGPALGSNNPLTSVPRAVFGSNFVTRSAVVRTGFAGIAIAGAAIGGYNAGVLISGFVYAALP